MSDSISRTASTTSMGINSPNYVPFNPDSFQNISITSHSSNGSYFLQWSQSVQLFIRGRGKFGFLSGTTPKPATTPAMVMIWLINSMEPSVGRTYLFLPSAASIWTAVNETYSDLGNTSQLYELKTQLRKANRCENYVTQYYTELKTLWQESDLFCDIRWHCTQDQVMFQRMIEKERVFEFLACLNTELDNVRGRILGRDPLPSSREVFTEVRREKSHRSVMLGGSSTPKEPLLIDSSAFSLASRNHHDNLDAATVRSVIIAIVQAT